MLLRLITALLCLVAASPARAREAYYVVVFAAQGRDYNVSLDTHNFATFLHADGATLNEAFTISWLPRTLRICLLCSTPEPGINLTLEESLALETRNGLRISSWGPAEIKPSLYEAARVQWQKLTKQRVYYQLNDRDTRPQGINCIHAITDVTQAFGQSSLTIGATWGDAAGVLIYNHLRPWMTDPRPRGIWIRRALNLDRWHVVSRTGGG